MSTDLILVNALVGVLLPLLVQLIAKSTASAAVKSLINLLLAGSASILTPLTVLDHVDWKVVGLSLIQLYVTTITTHYGLLKPVGVTGYHGAIAKAVPGGVGESSPPVAE